MNYVKVIRMSGSFFAREFQKKEKVKKNIKYREVDEKTVLDQFLKEQASIEVIFEDIDREPISIDINSERQLIKKYLGERFISDKY